MSWSSPRAAHALSDESLLAGLAVGDPDAGAAFIRRFQRRVFGLARAVLSDDALAEDVSQEAFVRAWRHAAAYDSRRGSVATWLLTITRNLAIDASRLRRAVAADPGWIVEWTDERTVAGRTGAERSPADVLAVRQAVAGLPEDQRRALLCAAVLGMTAREIGELEHVPLGTAKTRVRTGLRRLRSALAPDAEEASP